MRYKIRASKEGLGRDLEKTGSKLYGLDIETECNVGCTSQCDHALDHNKNKIVLIAITNAADEQLVFHGETMWHDFTYWINRNPKAVFTAHAGKFDFKNLIHHLGGEQALHLLDRWVDDSSLQAFSYDVKIPDSWLANYEAERRALNKARKGHKHREAGKHSLKTLAPYFLGVDPFWEPEHGHNDLQYVIKDANYALQLTDFFNKKMPAKALEFYRSKQLPWAKHLILLELRGITVDMDELNKQWAETEVKLQDSKKMIKAQWSEFYSLWDILQKQDVEAMYKAREITKKLSQKQLLQNERNKNKALAKLQGLNIDSPKQLTWLLKDQLGLDIHNLDGDESTDKETLQRLSLENHEIKALLDYRKAKKLCSTYFPEYANNYIVGEKIYTSFNPIGARTGRLSSSNPNCQQIPGALHSMFVSKQGKLLITRDLAAIEPTILAYYSEDPELCRIMLERGDFHGETAKAAFNLECAATDVKKLYPQLRGVAKTVGLAVLYGAGANQVLIALKKAGLSDYTLTDAKRIVEGIRGKYAGVWKFKQEIDGMLESGKTLYNLLGRPLSIEDPEDVYMKGLNTLIQSSASDLLQEGALLINDNLEQDVLLLVHDEVVTEVPEEIAEDLNLTITNLLANIVTLQTSFGVIPIRTDGKVGREWTK